MFLGLERFDREREALIDDKGVRLTFGELCDFDHGFEGIVQRRSVVFILCKNCAAAMAGYLSFMNLKIVPLLLAETMDAELLNSLIETYKPRYLWLPEDKADQFEEYSMVYKRLGYVLVDCGNEVYPIYEDLSMLLTTSGSTGSPKLVRHSYKNIEANAKHVAEFFGFTQEDRGMADLPMQYTMGLNVILSHLIVGATVLLASNNLMSPDFWTFFKDERATDFTGVPFSYEVLMKLRFTRMKLPHLRIIAEGGGRLTDDMFKTLVEYAQQTNKQFFATFGTTETTARLAFLPPELALEKIGSIGRAIPGGELFLIDDHGKEINEIEAEGEVGYRGPNVTLGYAVCIRDLEKDDERHGVYLTGDLAKRDHDGCYYIVGRKTRFLKLYGLRVSLDQCERIIKTYLEIDNACVGNDKSMEVYITDASKCDLVKSFLMKKTGVYGAAINVHYISEIPRNESGKIKYNVLMHRTAE